MSLYRDHGVVLRTIRLGESDRIVTMLTHGRGKVRAVAKGIRKTKSKFGGRLEPMTHVSALFYEGRELDLVTQAESIDTFRSIREDLDRVGRATSMLEAVDQVSQEGEQNVRLYQMLVGALRALETRQAPVILGAFFWKLLAAEGYQPVLDQCSSCGAADELVAFDVDAGGALCRTCRTGIPISAEALDLARRILGGGLSGALDEPAGPAVHENETVATRALEHHLERRLRSIRVLDRA